MECLFIGGPWDGEWRCVQDSRYRLIVREPQESLMAYLDNPTPCTPEPCIEHEYLGQLLSKPHTPHSVDELVVFTRDVSQLDPNDAARRAGRRGWKRHMLPAPSFLHDFRNWFDWCLVKHNVDCSRTRMLTCDPANL